MAKRTVRVGLPRKEWSFLAYIAGDNSLSDFGLIDIREMCKVGSSQRVHVGVQMDTAGDHDGVIRYEVTEPDATGKAHRMVIERLPESDSGAPETLLAFLKWGVARYPSTHAVVVVWNHGSGFRGAWQPPRRDIAYDDAGTSLDMPEIRAVLTKAGFGKRRKLAVLGFDACLMAMLEIAHHLRDHVDVVVGSQQTEPGDGWPYADVLSSVKRSRSALQLGRRIVSDYLADYRRKMQQNVTQSAVATARTGEALAALGSLGTALVAQPALNFPVISLLRPGLQAFEDSPDYVDAVHLGRLLGEAGKGPKVRTAARRLVRLTKRCVVANGSFGNSVANANGASIWFPFDRVEYLKYRPAYLALDLPPAASGWVEFLDRYFA